MIHTTIENNKSIKKKVKQKLMTGTKRLFKMQKGDVSTTSNQYQILQRVQDFYSSLYNDAAKKIALDSVEKTDVPIVLPAEVKSAIQSWRIANLSGQDEIGREIPEPCESESYRALAHLFTQCLKQQNIPTSWKDVKVILLHKKENQKDLNNNRPISIRSVIYKLLTRIIARRFETILDSVHRIEQAGSTSGYYNNNNLP